MMINPHNQTTVMECQQLEKTFTEVGAAVEVLKAVDLSILQGERIAIVGSSGSGKSTLLHLLGGLDKPSAGKVWIAGNEINRLSETDLGRIRNKYLGFVYQLHHLLPEFTALENVAMPLFIRREPKGKALEKAAHLLLRVGLEHRLHHKPSELSGGERQRTAIARAMVNQPLCVLADEPTGNLDRRSAEQVYQLMLELNRELNISFVVVTHDMSLAEKMDKIYTLDRGTLSIKS